MKRFLVGVALAAISACTPTTESSQPTGPGGDDVCIGPLGAPLSMSDITAKDACCVGVEKGGSAHCIDSVPDELKGVVEACGGGGYCLPDTFLATGGSEPPASCTAFGGDGVCLSRCIPQVAMNSNLLKPDTCAGADELCVPCISPLDGTETGACKLRELAKCEGDDPTDPGPAATCDDPATCNYEASCPAVIDPSTLPMCAPDSHCVAPALITDPAQAAQLGKCEDNVSLCVPDTFIKTGGKFTSATCTSVAGAEGRCLSRSLPAVEAQDSLLPQDICTPDEKCTPCFDPISGMATGACTLSCDTGPTQPPKTFAACCEARAHCVPATSIPDDQEGQLSEQECQDDQPGSLCVPNEIIAGGPFPACNAHSGILGDYTGVCLSDCLDFGIQGIAIKQGNCAANYKCAPCETFGSPTGAPGCPP